MMNKKGFTVIELCVSFSLVSIIAIMLFNLIFSLKELYISGDIKTTLLNKQGIMTKKIYDDLNSRSLKSIDACGISCLNFRYIDGTAQLLIDVGANTITYDDYTMKLSEGTKIGQVKFEYGLSTNDNDVLNLDIPITTSLLDDDFGIHIVKLYDSSVSIDNTLAFDSATIIANGITMRLKTIAKGEDWSITKSDTNEPSIETSFAADESDPNSKVIFANIFHQEADTYFIDYNDFLKNNTPQKQSTLKSLEIFRSNSSTEAIKNVFMDIINSSQYDTNSEKNQKEQNKKIQKLNEDFSNGYFELILDYPGIVTGVSELQNYNRWLQTSNFTTSNEITQGINIDVLYSGANSDKWLGGLKLLYDNKKYIGDSYVNGSNNSSKLFGIGMKKNDATGASYKLSGPDNSKYENVPSVDIWVRVNDYIKKYGLVKLTY